MLDLKPTRIMVQGGRDLLSLSLSLEDTRPWPPGANTGPEPIDSDVYSIDRLIMRM